MAKPKCANCGAEMIEAYTKEGLKIYICVNTPTSHVKTVTGRVRRSAYVNCRNEDVKGLKAVFDKPTEDTNITVEKLEKQHTIQYPAQIY